MNKNLRAGLLAAVIVLPWFAATSARAAEEAKPAVAEAKKLLAQAAEQPIDVPACGKLAERVATISGAEAELLRYQVLARCLWHVTYENREQKAIASFLEKLGEAVIFSEPSGEYYVSRQRLWDLYEKAKASPAAEEIAWEAAKTPAGGECEGYLNCYLGDSLDSIGRYLELYPQGKFTAAALEELYWLQEEPSGVEAIDRADVPEAKQMLDRWRKILAAVPGGKDYLKGVDMIAGAYQVR